ncbi:IclR family transcriptional regulator [Marasmitruncus massiliensis]|uniref:IclR family transcriptional regulator n=1 Tax=Marasmitruncus massiliensis TaxID=1944642 RepID=UPI000C7D5E4E|nr:IclR family transcriptional regulator [Marasmitruncus massiliensis]
MPEVKRNLTPPNQSSDKLLSILEMMAKQTAPLRLQDIATLCGMHSSTALRFLSALQKRNFVAQDPDTGRYYITFKICALAQSVSAYNDIRGIALPFLRSVANRFKESCNLAIEDDMTIMYIEVMNSPTGTLLSTQRIGNIAPMHCTGVGKLFLTDYSTADLDRYVAIKKLTRFTGHTITNIRNLSEELERIRDVGYAFDNEECEAGVRCIAAPIRDYTGKVHAGLSVSGPSVRMTDEFIYTNLEFLLETARQISMCMGWRADW